jgi:hypothetical protein
VSRLAGLSITLETLETQETGVLAGGFWQAFIRDWKKESLSAKSVPFGAASPGSRSHRGLKERAWEAATSLVQFDRLRVTRSATMSTYEPDSQKIGGHKARAARIELQSGETLDVNHYLINEAGWLCVYEESRNDRISRKIPAANVKWVSPGGSQ